MDAPVTETSYTPYDLIVVPKEFVERKDVEHYTATSSGFVHVRPGVQAEFTPLGEWMRDASVFSLLRQMKFFKHYLVSKAFSFWRGNVRHKTYAAVRAKIAKKLFVAKRSFGPALREIGALCHELREAPAIALNPIVTYDVEDFAANQEKQVAGVLVPTMESIHEKTQKILERVVRDAVDQVREYQAAMADADGIANFVSKTKSMVALKRERIEKARNYRRVTEESVMLPSLIRLADYMLAESFVAMAQNNLAKLLDAMEHPDPKSKGIFSTSVGFAHELTTFEPNEKEVLAAINGRVLDGVAEAVGQMPRLVKTPAFAPLFEVPTDVVDPDAAAASTGKRPEGLAPMAVLTGEAYPESEDAVTSPPGEAAYAKPGRCRPKPWGDARRALDAKIASSFAEAREYVKTYEDLRGIYNFGLEWDNEAYEQTPKTVAAFREDMKVQKGWVQDLDRMKTGSNEGVLHVDGKALRGSLTSSVVSCLESMKALLLVKAREEATKTGGAFVKRVKSLAPRPDDLDGFAALLETHQRHEAGKKEYNAEHGVVEDMFNMLVSYEMKIPASDQVRLDDLNEARARFAESMSDAGEYLESRKAEMMKALKVGVSDVEERLFKIQTSLNDGAYVDRESEPADVLDDLAKVRAELDEHAARCETYKKYQALFQTPVGAFSNLDFAAKEYETKHESWNALHASASTAKLDAEPVRDAEPRGHQQRRGRRVHGRVQDAQAEARRPGGDAHAGGDRGVQEVHAAASGGGESRAAASPLGEDHRRRGGRPGEASHLPREGSVRPGEPADGGAAHGVGRDGRPGGARERRRAGVQGVLSVPDARKMQAEWEGLDFRCKEYKDTGTFTLVGTEEVQALLDDQIVKAQGMCASPFVKPFEEDAKAWSATLNTLQDLLDNWLKCQSTWLYLEPIFSSEDIVKQMPEEGEKFRQVDNEWRDIMKMTQQAPEVIAIGNDKDRLERLEECNILLESIKRV